ISVHGRNNSFSVVMVGTFTAQHAGLRDDFANARAAAEAAEKLSAKLGFQQQRPAFRIVAGWARACMNEVENAVEAIRTALTEAETLGFRLYRQYFLSCLAETQTLASAVGDALDTINQTLKTDPDNRWYRPLALT